MSPFGLSTSLRTSLVCVNADVRLIVKKMLKVGRNKKKRREEKNHINSIARIRARASPPAVSFAFLKLYQAAKETKYKITSISEYYVTITRPTVWSEKDTSHVVSNANKGKKKSEVNRANIFCKYLFDCHRCLARNIKKALLVNWLEPKTCTIFEINFNISVSHSAYITFRIIMSFRKPCHMPFRKLIRPFTLTGIFGGWRLNFRPFDSDG